MLKFQKIRTLHWPTQLLSGSLHLQFSRLLTGGSLIPTQLLTMKMCHPAELVSQHQLNYCIATSNSPPTDAADFNTTIFEVIFPGDAGLVTSLVDIDSPIRVYDDTKDEAGNQFFIAYLELVNARNPDTIVIGREWATIIIVDNDSKRIIKMSMNLGSHSPIFSYTNWL